MRFMLVAEGYMRKISLWQWQQLEIPPSRIGIPIVPSFPHGKTNP